MLRDDPMLVVSYFEEKIKNLMENLMDTDCNGIFEKHYITEYYQM